MRLIRGLERWDARRAAPGGGAGAGTAETGVAATGTVATIGNFDGVHLGHLAMLARLRDAADRLALPAVVTSFEPLPREHFDPGGAPPRLQGLRDRVASLRDAGVDRLLLLRFDAELAALTADEFVDRVLVGALGVRHLVIGDDFRFGRGRAGDFDFLVGAGSRSGFTVERAETVKVDADGDGAADTRVSSTRVRELLAACELDAAARLLGRPYRISGRVVHGEKVGRTLGFPTANVRLGSLRPAPRGVFAVRATVLETGEAHDGVANLGERPTVGGRKLLLEVNVLDGSPELYGRHLAVDFLHFIRGEQRFGSLDELKAQIAKDAVAARGLLAG